MPDIDDSAAQRGASSARNARHLKFQPQRHAGFDRAVGRVSTNVGTFDFLIDEVGAFSLLRTDYAGRWTRGKARRDNGRVIPNRTQQIICGQRRNRAEAQNPQHFAPAAGVDGAFWLHDMVLEA
jgi:hypothetical protein